VVHEDLVGFLTFVATNCSGYSAFFSGRGGGSSSGGSEHRFIPHAISVSHLPCSYLLDYLCYKLFHSMVSPQNRHFFLEREGAYVHSIMCTIFSPEQLHCNHFLLKSQIASSVVMEHSCVLEERRGLRKELKQGGRKIRKGNRKEGQSESGKGGREIEEKSKGNQEKKKQKIKKE